MPWRARIRDGGDRVLGAGILLGTQHVLTCTHLLLEGADGAPMKDRTADFVGLPGTPPVQVRIAEGSWVPPLDGGRGDVALLELERPQPDGAGAELHRMPQAWGRAVRVYGFPPGFEMGVWVRATLTDSGGPGGEWVGLNSRGNQLGAGFSGAAVVDDETGRLVGMVITGAAENPEIHWMSPVETIVRYIPRVAAWIGAATQAAERLDRLTKRVSNQMSTAGATGSELVSLPRGELPDPTSRILAGPQVPEHHRVCVQCGTSVGRTHAGRPGVTEGFCSSCGTPFSFAPRLRPDEMVGGRYKILGCIARGGFGWIYLATDRHLADQHVILKGLINTTGRSTLALTRAERRILIELDHPNLVRTLAFVDHDDPDTDEPTDYIVMEYVGGLSLREVKRRAKWLRAEQVATYGLEILGGLEYLHGHGLLYCDMKPDNVIQNGDRIKIIDLGAVRPIGDRHSPIVGTRTYQVGRQEIIVHGLTVRSDIYTVGVTLRELLQVSADWSEDPEAAGESRGIELGVESLRRVVERATTEFQRRFASAAEMSEQLAGVLREILSLRDQLPRPAPSTVFEEPVGLLDAELGRVPQLEAWTAAEREAFSDGRPSPRQAADALPMPLRDVDDSGVRMSWGGGLAALADGDVVAAQTAFDAVYAALPGETAPKLALGFCAEFLGDSERAERYYEAVWRRDRTQVSAGFGLARLYVTRGDRVSAAAVLDEVPAGSRYRDAAEVAAVRILTARLPIVTPDNGLPNADELSAALHRLPQLRLDDEERDRLTTAVLEIALDWIRTPGRQGMVHPEPILPSPLTEYDLRALLAESYRNLAHQTHDTVGHRALLNRTKAIRPKRWPRRKVMDERPGFGITVSQNKYLSLADSQMHAILTVTAPDTDTEPQLTIRIFPNNRLRFLKQVFPIEAAITEHGVQMDEERCDFSLGSWAPTERREYHLCLDLQTRDPVFDEDQLLAQVKLTAIRQDGRAEYSGAPEPILGYWIREPLLSTRFDPKLAWYTAQLTLDEAVLAGCDAYDAKDLDRARAQWGAAVTLATELGNEEILRRLRRLVDIVDVDTGLVSLKKPLSHSDLVRSSLAFSERLSVHSHRSELVSSSRQPQPRYSLTELGECSSTQTHNNWGTLWTVSSDFEPTVQDSLTLQEASASLTVQRPFVKSDRACLKCGWVSPATAVYCGACGHLFGEKPPNEPEPTISPRRARVWCVTEGPTEPGKVTRVAFALVRQSTPADEPTPLRQPIRLRVLLEAGSAAVRPVTQVAVLAVDRITDPIEFDVVPAGREPVPLVFRVYRDRDSQLLQEIRAELPVGLPFEEVAT